MEQPIDVDTMASPNTLDNLVEDRWYKLNLPHLLIIQFFFLRESEQNVHDIDQNDPIAREMSNTDILDSLEAQANNATNLDSFFFASHAETVASMHERYLKNCVASLYHEQLSQS